MPEEQTVDIQPKPQQYYVLTRNRDERVGYENKCVLWWRPEGAGYTTNLDEAGLFTDAHKEAGYPHPERCIYVPKEVVDAASRCLRLAWWDAIQGQMRRGQGSGPLPGRDVTVVQTGAKTLFVKPLDCVALPYEAGLGKVSLP